MVARESPKPTERGWKMSKFFTIFLSVSIAIIIFSAAPASAKKDPLPPEPKAVNYCLYAHYTWRKSYFFRGYPTRSVTDCSFRVFTDCRGAANKELTATYAAYKKEKRQKRFHKVSPDKGWWLSYTCQIARDEISAPTESGLMLMVPVDSDDIPGFN